jgi:hypothetical protein
MRGETLRGVCGLADNVHRHSSIRRFVLLAVASFRSTVRAVCAEELRGAHALLVAATDRAYIDLLAATAARSRYS